MTQLTPNHSVSVPQPVGQWREALCQHSLWRQGVSVPCGAACLWEQWLAFRMLVCPWCSGSLLLSGAAVKPCLGMHYCMWESLHQRAPERRNLGLAQGAGFCDTRPAELYKREICTRSSAMVSPHGCILFSLYFPIKFHCRVNFSKAHQNLGTS